MLKQIFILCSGADTDILNDCSIGEQNKYAGIRATVFFTALTATETLPKFVKLLSPKGEFDFRFRRPRDDF